LLADALTRQGRSAAAAELLARARALERRWADWKIEADYSHELLRLDPRDVERIERRLQAHPAAP
jgi:hypothetical protein